MKNKKGFTLIELLAVIVILAVIALIAVPQVLKILKQSRISAAEDSVYGIVNSVEQFIASELLNNAGNLSNDTYEFKCNGNSCVTDDNKSLDFKGTVPKSGTVTISKSGEIITASSLSINNFVCSYSNNKAECADVLYSYGNITSTDYNDLKYKNGSKAYVFKKFDGKFEYACGLIGDEPLCIRVSGDNLSYYDYLNEKVGNCRNQINNSYSCSYSDLPDGVIGAIVFRVSTDGLEKNSVYHTGPTTRTYDSNL